MLERLFYLIQENTLPMSNKEYPVEFWQSIRFITDFNNHLQYKAYLEKRKIEWNEKGFIDHSIK